MTQPTPRKIEVVAELAQGFEGKPQQASLLVRAAARAKADAAKFQMVFADELATPKYKYYDLFRSLEMSDEVWAGLAEEARTQGIGLQVDIFGRRSLDLAERIGVDAVKLHGTDIGNPGLLRDVAQSGIARVFLGAGGAHRDEIDAAVDILGGKSVVVLLGFQAYPTPTETNQIDRVRHLADHYADAGNVMIGFADHADPESPLRIALACAALGAGAQVIEKHLTLGRNMEIEDFESALNPDQFQEFVTTVRDTHAALGVTAPTHDFGMSEAESGYRRMIRRHVVAARDLPAGTVLGAADVVLKRAEIDDPITSPADVIGRSLTRAVAANRALCGADLEAGR